MRRLAAVLLLLAFSAAPAFAQDDRSKRVDLARAFVELTSADSVMNPMIDAIWTERRSIVRVTVRLKGVRRGLIFKVCRLLERGSARLRRLSGWP